MKILICAMSSDLGGMERRIQMEAELLIQMGHSVVVATPRFAKLDEWRASLTRIGASHVVWEPYKAFERMHCWPPLLMLTKLTSSSILRMGFDFAHVCLPWNFVGLSMAYALATSGIPYVLSVHCRFGKHELNPRVMRHFRFALSSCIGAYGVSRPVTDSFFYLYKELLPRRHLVVTVPNGVDVHRFVPNFEARVKIREALGFRQDDQVVIFCGRLDAMKRPELAARAFVLFAANAPDARLLVVGSGAEEMKMREILSSSFLSDRVRFPGFVSDTAPYFSASDCYLSTSRGEEGYSLTAAEALSSGLPIVVPGDDVFRSIYGECDQAFFSDSPDPGVWAESLGIALASRGGAAGEARRYAEERLSLLRMNEALHLFYQCVFNRLSDDAGRSVRVNVEQ